jgi:hypothetical protein
MMNSWPTKPFIVIAACAGVAYGVPVGAQTLKKEPDANQLSCGQKVLVENNTCPADQILQVTGSCLNTIPMIDMTQTARGTQYAKGTQYNCIKRTQRHDDHK